MPFFSVPKRGSEFQKTGSVKLFGDETLYSAKAVTLCMPTAWAPELELGHRVTGSSL